MAAMSEPNPFTEAKRRAHVDAAFAVDEVRLANRNAGILLETLRHDVTPVGLHYLLNHFDVPSITDDGWQLSIGGKVARPMALSIADLKQLPARTLRVTMECAGNGRGLLRPRYPSMPWLHEAVGTAEWTGTALRHVLERAQLKDDVLEVAFVGADRGFDRGVEHNFGRSLSRELALSEHVLLAWAMNGHPLPPQHGHPLRLIVPGWYGMGNVKWLARIEALAEPYQGFQQAVGYHYRAGPGLPGTPVTHMRVKSLLVPPGIPDWYSRQRLLDAGVTELFGRAWSGGGVPVAQVEIGINGRWHEATLAPQAEKFAWQGWRYLWQAEAGEYELACRATDANGLTQPLEPRWDAGGFGNNAVHRLQVWVR
jgi:DMSO/TMAO reductase YedYZ molybdopterin-dependent catalytic subunit